VSNRKNQPPAELKKIVTSFAEIARAKGYDTFEGSSGRCWYIANEFAVFAAAEGMRVEFRRIENKRSTRFADDVNNYTVREGWAIDFSSRGGALSKHAPWPRVQPVAEFEARYGGPLVPVCQACGSLAADHDRAACDGPFPLAVYLKRMQAPLVADLRKQRAIASMLSSAWSRP
jgi:hypothetical protein